MRNVIVCMAVAVSVAACGAVDEQGDVESVVGSTSTCNEPQVFGSPSHGGAQGCPALTNMHVVKQIVQDPDADAVSDQDGFYQFYGMPVLTQGDWVVVPTKSGFTSVLDRTTERYHVTAYRWFPSVTSPNRELVGPMWSADTDWTPVDAQVNPTYITFGYVQAFGAAISGGSVWIPAVSGQIDQRDLQTGQLIRRINPFAGTQLNGDPKVGNANYPSVDFDGSVWYAAAAWPTVPDAISGDPVRGSYVIRISPVTGAATIVDLSPENSIKIAGPGIATHAVGVKDSSDLCPYAFGTQGSGPPTGPDSQPIQLSCGPQRPGLNAAFAFTSRGPLIRTVSNNTRSTDYLIEVDRNTLLPLHATNTQNNHLGYGCGVRLSLAFPGCAAVTANGATNLGADPDYNLGDNIILDIADIDTQAPVIAPDGSWTWGAYDHGFVFDAIGTYDAQGALLRWDSTGNLLASNKRFGWNATPAVVPTSSGFMFALDQEIYNQFDLRVAIETPDFTDLVSGVSTNQDDGADFVDQQVSTDVEGGFYGVTEGDGLFHHFDSTGSEVETLQLTKLDGSPADEFTMPVHTVSDASGDRFVTAGGVVNVVMSSDSPTPQATRAHLPPRSGHAAKLRALKNAQAQTQEPILPSSRTVSSTLKSNICTADDPDCGPPPGSIPPNPWTLAQDDATNYADSHYPGAPRRLQGCVGNDHSVMCTLMVWGVQIVCTVHVNPVDGVVTQGCTAVIIDSPGITTGPAAIR